MLNLFRRSLFRQDYCPAILSWSAWIIIGIGITLRLAQYLANRSLWLDESRLALNIVHRSFSQLMQPLDYGQGAPLGFLMLVKLMVQILGDSEYALRLVPFLSGILSLFLFYQVAKRCVGPKAIVIGLGLFSLSDLLIYYSSELKQYSSDTATALFLSLMALGYLEREKLVARDIMLFGLIGSIAIWFSHPSVFILAGAGATLIFVYLRGKKWRDIGQLCVVCSLWLLSFAISYFISLRTLTQPEGLPSVWRGSFMPFPPLSFSDMRWFASKFFEISSLSVGQSLPGLAALAFIIGCSSMLRTEKYKFLILTSPLLFTLLASGFHKYPFSGRLLLFIVPSLLLLISQGAEEIMEKTRHAAVIGITTVGLLFFHPLFYASHNLINPRTREEIKPIIHYLKEHRQDGDLLYLYSSAESAFKYYQAKYGFTDRDYIVGVASRDNERIYVNDLEKLRGHKRVWVLFSHVKNREGPDEERFFLYHLDGIGRRLDAFKSAGGAVYLYDLKHFLNN